jgi:putative peptidoglycan lipid II flippase
MSRLVAEGRLEEMNRLMNRTLRYLALVIPFSVLLIVLRHEVVFILFQRGRFDAAATTLTSHLLPFLLLGAFPFSAQTVVVRGYYATQNTLFPALFGTGAVLLSIPFYILSMDRLGAAGVALGVSISALLQVIVLYALWNRHSKNQEGQEVYGFVVKITLFSILLGVVLEMFKKVALAWIDPWALSGAFMTCLATGLLFSLLLFLAGRFAGMEEIREILSRSLRKLRS